MTFRLQQLIPVGLLLVCLTTVGTGQKASTEIDLRVNSIRSGTTYNRVLRLLGRPDRKKTEHTKASQACSNSAETDVTLKYQGLEVDLIGYGRARKLSVYRIEVTSRKWAASGTRIGETFESVRKKFGKPDSIEGRSGEQTLYYGIKGSIGNVDFYFRKGRLVRILMNETLC